MKEWDRRFSPRWLRYFFLVNWVLGFRKTQVLISTKCITIYDGEVIDCEAIGSANQRPCLPKAVLNTKTLPNGRALLSFGLSFGWFFGVQLDFLEKSIAAHVEKSVDLIPSQLAT